MKEQIINTTINTVKNTATTAFEPWMGYVLAGVGVFVIATITAMVIFAIKNR